MSVEFEKSETRYIENTEVRGDGIVMCHRNGKDGNEGWEKRILKG